MSSTCQHCGARYFPQAAAWGNAICGDCIADTIQLALIGGQFTRARKPMRRADGLANLAKPIREFAEAPRKVVGG